MEINVFLFYVSYCRTIYARNSSMNINQAKDIAQFGNNCDGNVIYSENEFQLYRRIGGNSFPVD